MFQGGVCTEMFSPYVDGAQFEVITDHYSLLWLMCMQYPHCKLARWAIRLQQLSFIVPVY